MHNRRDSSARDLVEKVETLQLMVDLMQSEKSKRQ